MISLISCTSPLKIRSEMSGELSMTSMAATRPRPFFGSRALRDHCAQVQREVHQQLRPTFFGKKLMMRSMAWLALLAQRRQAEVAGFGEGDGVVHRLAVADLAHQDHVRRLAQRVLQRRLPAVGVDADLALRDDAVLVISIYSIGSSIVMMWP